MTQHYKSFTNSVKYWYILLLLGILFIVCGFYIFTVPVATYLTLTFLFSMFFIISGFSEILFSVLNTKSLNDWGWYLVSGILNLVVGLYLINYPAVLAAALPFFIGFTVLFRSFSLFGFALYLKDTGDLKWGNLAIASIIVVIFSILLILNPIFSTISIVTLTALSFIFIGIASILLSFQLKKIKNYPSRITPELKLKIQALQDEITNSTKTQTN